MDSWSDVLLMEDTFTTQHTFYLEIMTCFFPLLCTYFGNCRLTTLRHKLYCMCNVLCMCHSHELHSGRSESNLHRMFLQYILVMIWRVRECVKHKWGIFSSFACHSTIGWLYLKKIMQTVILVWMILAMYSHVLRWNTWSMLFVIVEVKTNIMQ